MYVKLIFFHLFIRVGNFSLLLEIQHRGQQENGERFHKQQTPLALLIRIILSSSKVGDWILDPFAGTGTTLVVAKEMGIDSIGCEIDLDYANFIHQRLK